MKCITLSNPTRLSDSPLVVDESRGLILNVSIITAGPAIGHGFSIDATMLGQIANLIASSKKGIRSRLTHCDGLFSGRDPVEVMVGRVQNGRVEGNQVRGDVKLADYAAKSPSGDLRGYLLGVAKEDPEAIGLSISYEPATSESGANGEELARCKRLYAVDFVGEPAANPSGLLSAGDPGQPNEGDEEMPGTQEIVPVKAPDLAPAVVPATAPAPTTLSETPAPSPAPVASAESLELAAKRAAEVALVADRDRREKIMGLAREKNIDLAVAQGWADRGVTLAHATELVELSMSNAPVKTASVSAGEDLNKSTLSAGMSDAIMLRAGRPVEKPHDRAREFNGLTLMEMGRRFLSAYGVPTDGLTRMELAGLLFSRAKMARAAGDINLALGTSDFPYILANVANKTLRQAYELAPTTWAMWARRATAPDFKQISRVQLGNTPALAAMAEGAEYTYGTVGEDREVYTLAKYGKGLKLTREMVINDDLSAFTRVVPMMGMMARYLEDDVAYAILTANAVLADNVDLFHATHANVGTGAISVASLGAGRAAMRLQKAKDAKTFLNLAARSLIVPAALETTAEQFIASVVDPAKSNAVPNPFANKLQVVAEPRLDGTSAAVWYLAADVAMWDTVEVCFLEGEPAPVVEEEEDFDTDARKYKVRHQVAAKAIDYRGLFRSTGV